jgi:hypothetical protein
MGSGLTPDGRKNMIYRTVLGSVNTSTTMDSGLTPDGRKNMSYPGVSKHVQNYGFRSHLTAGGPEAVLLAFHKLRMKEIGTGKYRKLICVLFLD